VSTDYPAPIGEFRTNMTWREAKPFIAQIRRELEAALAEAGVAG
jgi:hypothetical protein